MVYSLTLCYLHSSKIKLFEHNVGESVHWPCFKPKGLLDEGIYSIQFMNLHQTVAVLFFDSYKAFFKRGQKEQKINGSLNWLNRATKYITIKESNLVHVTQFK